MSNLDAEIQRVEGYFLTPKMLNERWDSQAERGWLRLIHLAGDLIDAANNDGKVSCEIDAGTEVGQRRLEKFLNSKGYLATVVSTNYLVRVSWDKEWKNGKFSQVFCRIDNKEGKRTYDPSPL